MLQGFILSLEFASTVELSHDERNGTSPWHVSNGEAPDLTTVFTFHGKGKGVWDEAGGRVSKLVLTGPCTISVRSPETWGQSTELRYSGVQRISVINRPQDR